MSDSPTLEASSVLKIAPTFRFQFEEAQNAWVLLYPEGMVTMGGSAGEILKRVDGTASIGDIIASLREAFDGADVDDDVYAFLNQACENGWLKHV